MPGRASSPGAGRGRGSGRVVAASAARPGRAVVGPAVASPGPGSVILGTGSEGRACPRGAGRAVSCPDRRQAAGAVPSERQAPATPGSAVAAGDVVQATNTGTGTTTGPQHSAHVPHPRPGRVVRRLAEGRGEGGDGHGYGSAPQRRRPVRSSTAPRPVVTPNRAGRPRSGPTRRGDPSAGARSRRTGREVGTGLATVAVSPVGGPGSGVMRAAAHQRPRRPPTPASHRGAQSGRRVR